MRIVVTGGAGYIGSHSLVEILKAEHEVLVIDNFCNASPEALSRVKRLANRDFEILEGDVRDGAFLGPSFENFRPDAVIHFAGLKAVGESVEKPVDYYSTNVYGSIELLKAMDAANCQQIVFSSTATVYGTPKYLPYDEKHPLAPESPYGRSKLMVENIISDWTNTSLEKCSVMLRYFNPVGAHESGEIGEDPFGYPNNLMPYIQQVAIGRREELTIHGNDYDTEDGTGVRDYIHIKDLAEAHLAAVNYTSKMMGHHVFNIGSGKGHSVIEAMQSFEKVSGKTIPHHFGPRRAGDIACFFANPSLANKELGWKSELSLDDMCRSAWEFQKRNPEGYKK